VDLKEFLDDLKEKLLAIQATLIIDVDYAEPGGKLFYPKLQGQSFLVAMMPEVPVRIRVRAVADDGDEKTQEKIRDLFHFAKEQIKKGEVEEINRDRLHVDLRFGVIQSDNSENTQFRATLLIKSQSVPPSISSFLNLIKIRMRMESQK